jgi:hypothetical protein
MTSNQQSGNRRPSLGSLEIDISETNAVICRHCGKTRLDHTKCTFPKHQLVDLSSLVDKIFTRFIDGFIIDKDEMMNLGTVTSSNVNLDNLARKSGGEFVSKLSSETVFLDMINARFPLKVSEKIKDLEKAEEEYHLSVKKIITEAKKRFNEEHKNLNVTNRNKLWAAEQNRLYRANKPSFSVMFRGLLSDSLIDKIKAGKFDQNAELFKTFLSGVHISVLSGIFQMREYQEYLAILGQPSIEKQEFYDLYRIFCVDEIEEVKDQFFSVDSVLRFLKTDLIYYMTASDEKRRKFFLNELKKYKDSGETAYSEYIGHIKYVILVKLLRSAESELLIPPSKPYKTNYMISSLLQVTRPYNHTLGISLGGVGLNYLFKNPFGESRRGLREVTQVRSSQEVKKVYDFLEFYTSIYPSERMPMIVYRQGNDVRIKRYGFDDNSYLPGGSSDPAMEEDKGANELLEKYSDYTAVYFAFGENVEGLESQYYSMRRTKALFDHYNSSCYLSGTSEEIKEMIEILNSIPGVSLVSEHREFISFFGSFEIKTRAILVKPILEQIFLIPHLARYWYPKSVSSVAGNYVYIYSSEKGNVPLSSRDYVSLRISPLKQYSITDKIWSLVFNGNSQLQIVPFISMTIALLQMLENIIYDRRFDLYRKAEQEYSAHYQKKQSSEQPTSGAIAPMLYYGLTKREIYTASLRSAGMTKEQINLYEDRSRPFLLSRFKSGSEEEIKWRIFYASVIARINPLCDPIQLSSANNVNFRAGFNRLDLYKNPDLKNNKNFLDAFENLKFFPSEGEFQYKGRIIGMIHLGYLFLCYPEKGNVHIMALKSNMPSRTSEYIGGTETNERQNSNTTNQRKRDSIPPGIVEIVSQFGLQPRRLMIFNPQKSLTLKFKDYVLGKFETNVIRALLAQHLWDHNLEEMINKLEELDVYIHQDLLQNLLEVMILCFVVDPDTKEYKFQMPRHNQWYAITPEYTNVTFLFKTERGDYEIVLFENSADFAPINHYVLSFIRQGLFAQEQKIPLKYQNLISLLREEDKLEGQLFNSNGKCIGFRVRSGDNIMDLRISPQAPVMVSHKNSTKPLPAKRLAYISDTKTNVDQKFGLFANDSRFNLIERKRSRINMPVTELYEKSRNWKHRVYLFNRMVLTHWMFWHQEYPGTIDEYIMNFINPGDPKRVMIRQEIEYTVIPEIHNSVENFSTYLSRVYPNVFYENTFHVVIEELQRIRDYLKREIEVISNYPPSFMRNFMNSRIDTKLIGNHDQKHNEMVGMTNIEEAIRSAEVKYQLLDNSYYLYMDQFNGDVDPLSITKNQVKKAELVLTEFDKKLFFIRLTRIGLFEVACYIAHMWHKEKKIMKYDETNPMTTSARRFTLRGNIITENSDNNEGEIATTGQNYWILAYTRFETPSNGRGNPIQKITYAAMLPINPEQA